MLGFLFAEFVDMVEEDHGPEVADALLFDTEAPLFDSALEVSTPVFPTQTLAVLFGCLSTQVDQNVRQLQQSFASRVMHRLRRTHPALYLRHADLFDPLWNRSLAVDEDEAQWALSLSDDPPDRLDVLELEALFGTRAGAQSLADGLMAELPASASGRSVGDRSGRSAVISSSVSHPKPNNCTGAHT